MIEQHRRPWVRNARPACLAVLAAVLASGCYGQPVGGARPGAVTGAGGADTASGGRGGAGQAGGNSGSAGVASMGGNPSAGGAPGGAAPGGVTPGQGGAGGGVVGPGGAGGTAGDASAGDRPAVEPSATDAHADAPVTVAACARGTVPPATVGCWINGHGATPLTRASYDGHIAVYHDRDVTAGAAAWVQPFMSQAFQYAKATYDPESRYGPDCLYVFLHQGRFLGGTISNYFDAFSNFRNATDVGASGWERGTNIDLLSHELAHIVEGASNGTHESPAFTVWGDSKWAELFQYDLYVALGLTADAERVFQKFSNTVENFPQPNTRWFRDWFYPLWRDHGKARVMASYFRLLAQHFPKRLENGNRNPIFTRRMTLAEYVHFTSGAAGKDLTALATTAFGTGFVAQMAKARADFPAVVY